MNILPNGKNSFSDDNGEPLVGGRLWTYQPGPGVTTPKDTYTDHLGGGVNTNPIILDARGEAEIFWDGGYNVRLEDASGGLIWTVESINTDPSAADLDAQLRADLANTSDPAKGDALIGVRRTDIVSAVALTLHDWNQRARVNVRQVGVTGDGSTDDAALLNTLGALGVPLYVPYTATGYLVGAPVTFSCDVYCEGFFTPTVAIGALAPDYARFAIILPSAGYANNRRFRGINVAGSVALRAAGVNGIRNDCENSIMEECNAAQLNYGIVIRSYSITVKKCNAYQCNTNLSAYARSTSLEINTLSIQGGRYDSAVNCAINIGDTSWSDAMAPNTSHGVNIEVTNKANIDGSELRADNCSALRLHIYSEGSSTNTAIRLGGAADGSIRNVRIVGESYFSNLDYAVRCYSGVEGLVVEECFYTNVRRSALYLTTDLYHFEYRRGTNVGSFTQGQEIHTGFRSLPLASVTFGNVTIPNQGIYRGRQTLLEDQGIWYPSGILQSGATVKTNLASAAARQYTTPSLTKAGTVAAGVFTFTTLADCYAFNGGDAITTAPAGATYVRSVDYAAGTMVIDGGVTAPGAATVSQAAAVFFSQTVTFTGSPPASGSWVLGDTAENGTGISGQAGRWKRVTTGSGNVLGTDWKVNGTIS